MKRINEMVLLRPWAMKQDTLMLMSQILERHLRGEKLSAEEIAAKIGDNKKDPSNYELIGSTARIPIYGVISKRASILSNISKRGTSVDEVQNDILTALDDPKVSNLLLDIDSPGGSVGGVAELADLIFSVRGKKPIVAYANGQMASAAYWLGSAADKIYASKSAEVGSIGVYTILQDYSVMDHNMGIKTHVIKAGKFKAAGSDVKPLTEDERAVIQEEINTYYDLFVDAIARHRDISREKVLELADGRVWIGSKAEKAGLVDGVRTFAQMIAGSSSGARAQSNATADSGSVDINTQSENSGQNKEEQAMELTIEKLKAEHKPLVDALLAEGKAAGAAEAKAEGRAEGLAEGKAAVQDAVKNETERCAGIVEAMPNGARKIAVDAIKGGLSKEAAMTSFLGAINSATPPTAGHGSDVDQDPTKVSNAKKDPTGKSHVEAAREYKKQNKCSMTEALKATAPIRP